VSTRGATDKRQGRQQRFRELYAERAQPFLESGEEIQAIFPAQIGMNPYLPRDTLLGPMSNNVGTAITLSPGLVVWVNRAHSVDVEAANAAIRA
jgi:hypothetical protein